MIDWTFSLSHLLTIIVLIGGFIAGYVRLGSKVGSIADNSREQRVRMHEQDMALQRLRQELTEFKVMAAEKYATYSAIEQMEERITVAINRLGDRLDGVFNLGGTRK